jgi:hypothetical protein
MPEKKASKAASPPAEAPMPTMGKPDPDAAGVAESGAASSLFVTNGAAHAAARRGLRGGSGGGGGENEHDDPGCGVSHVKPPCHLFHDSAPFPPRGRTNVSTQPAVGPGCRGSPAQEPVEPVKRPLRSPSAACVTWEGIKGGHPVALTCWGEPASRITGRGAYRIHPSRSEYSIHVRRLVYIVCRRPSLS